VAIYPPLKSRSISTTDGHTDDFDTFFKELRSRWVKIERLQEYDESDSVGYQAFKRGDYAEARDHVQRMVRSQTGIYSHARRFGVTMIRIRICDLPLSPYLVHYEIPAYLADIECGEDIRFVDARVIEDLLTNSGISDYVLFDDKRVTALIYDVASATLRDVLLAEDREVVRQYIDISDELIRRSVPMLESPIFEAVSQNYGPAR
jgi:hypothetical protein